MSQYKQVKPELFLFEKPYVSINGEGQHIGYPVIFVRLQGCPVGCVWCDAMGTWPEKKGGEQLGTKITFEALTELLDTPEFATTARIWFTGGEPTIWSAEIAAFIRYYKTHGNYKRVWHMITSGYNFYKPLLYVLDWITIDVKPPSSKYKTAEASEDFIGWAITDPDILPKIEFKMVVAKELEDVNFAMHTIAKFDKMPWTIQPLYWSEAEARSQLEMVSNGVKDPNVFLGQFAQPKGWESLEEFCLHFMNVVNNPNVRILPQLHKMIFPGRLSGI